VPEEPGDLLASKPLRLSFISGHILALSHDFSDFGWDHKAKMGKSFAGWGGINSRSVRRIMSIWGRNTNQGLFKGLDLNCRSFAPFATA
jgi:hypothetical protein